MNRPAITAIFVLVMAASVVRAEGSEFVMSATADLDGDGRPESITLTPLERRGGAFTLTVDEASVTDRLWDHVFGFKVVDIDEADRYKEVAVCTFGPSDDPQYFYFWYNGTELHRSGKVAGSPKLLGHGIVLVHCWMGFWYRVDKYVLTSQHTLRPVPQEFQWVGVEGTVQESFPIYSTHALDRVQARVRTGSKVLVVLCDLGEARFEDDRYLLKTERGQLGWVKCDALSHVGGLPAAG